ncbi:MAG TPA: hypothetical protein IAB68_01785 [Candidatus Aphodocola excrementigallinarum]|uniref:Phosphoenolpyruvate synthase n=1 Tax=Candidatus Aphodocola excrementigallinarum TaxID=2840670 RepID=A0A9D1IQE0_9FIRM|nr:hypothetical protein [Candidatus Aphodocola excrementigallinarum]
MVYNINVLSFIEVSYDEYKNDLNKIKMFITDPQWIWSLSYDIMINDKLCKDLLKYVDELDVNALDYSKIERIIKEVKNKSVMIMQEADKEKDPVIKWYLYRYSYAYYGFLETIIEGSVLTDAILKLFKDKYNEKYLDVIKEVDKIKPSELTKFEKNKNLNNVDINTQEIKLYLLMKKWQDIEHLYHNNELIKKHDDAKNNFEKYVKEKYPYLSSIKGRSLLGICLLNDSPIIKIEQLYKFFDNGIIDDLTCIVGGKNLGLAKLSYNGIDIPETFIVPVKSVQEKKYVNYINELPNYKYSVRSSATVEDNKNQSFAGLFITKLNQDKKDINSAISEVYDSTYTNRVKSYVEKFNTKKPYMSVVLQRFIEPEYAGVWLGNNKNTGHLEWVKGNGEKLVSGKVTPNYEDWNTKVNNPITVNNDVVGEKCIEYQNKLNTIADFEWCVVNGKLLFVQFRPVTVKFKNNDVKIIKTEDEFIGIPASSGVAKGKPVYIEDASKIDESGFEKGDILLADFTDPDWVPVMVNSSAIITAEGGFLSHSAIISRELEIPCITGLGYDNINKISNMDYIEVNGNNGVVKKLKTKKKTK